MWLAYGSSWSFPAGGGGVTDVGVLDVGNGCTDDADADAEHVTGDLGWLRLVDLLMLVVVVVEEKERTLWLL